MRNQTYVTRTGLSLLLISIAVLAGLMLLPGQAGPSQAQVSWLQTEQIVVTGTGTEGAVSASQSSSQPINGHVYAIYLDFADSITSTTDITITQVSPALTILQADNYYTDTWLYPAVEYTSSAGAGLSAYAPMPLVDEVTVAVGQAISGTIVTATVYWGE